MKKTLHVSMIFLITLLFFSGCVNRRGISATYYNSCEEYYDYQGYYHKKCDDNLIDFGTKEPKEPKPW